MREILLREAWESFHVEGHKLGFIHRITLPSKEHPEILTSTVTIMFGAAAFQHIFSFRDVPGYPALSYLFDTNDGAPVHVRFEQGEMICQVDELIFTEAVPADARPSYGNYPLIVTIPFVENAKVAFTQIDDSSCANLGTVELISHGWEDVHINGERLHLWQVVEYKDGQAGNHYWLDEARHVYKSNWRGATSYLVANKEEALRGLSAEFINRAEEILDKSPDSDWTDGIMDWLNQGL